MGSNSSESNAPKPGGLLARLFGMNQKKKANKQNPLPAVKHDETTVSVEPPLAETAPVIEAPCATEASASPVSEPGPVASSPAAEPVPPAAPAVTAVPVVGRIDNPSSIPEAPDVAADSVPLAAPVGENLLPMASPVREESVPPAVPDVTADEEVEMAPVVETETAVETEAPGEEIAAQLCPICSAGRKGSQSYCDDCGWMFPPGSAPAAVAKNSSPKAAVSRIKDRYELGELLSERGPVARYRGLDHGSGSGPPVPVTIVRMQAAEPAELLVAEEEALAVVEEGADDLEVLPDFDAPALGAAPMATAAPAGPLWPSVAWEEAFLENVSHPSLPRMIESFVDSGFECLIEEAPQGRSLWDAWDDPEATAGQRYGLLKQIADGVYHIHQGEAVFEALRPDLVVISDNGQVRFTDLGDLLPLPLPPDLQVRASLYTPPELVLAPEQADARADLYSFGAMLYALEYLHHELSESDFERQFSPKLITDRCPDVHPAFFRLVSKTFCRDANSRFPTDEAVKEDASGFKELMRTLDVCGRAFDIVRMDIAAWTTTGMVRTGNEDAFALLHAVESRQDDLGEYALILLADGMGGYEAGEVAAAMAIASLRKNLVQQKMFAALAGDNPPPEDQFKVEGCKQLLHAALKHANKEVYTASRTPGAGKRGMGCTAEAVYVDARNVVVGHVGDSRTYHLHQGRLVQLTRDQTFVNRMVELGALTPEEAEDHPRKNELQQAIGGQPDVQPGLYHGKLKRGDWVVVCSDGLSNHIPPEDLQRMLLREATSAEEAARRLLNLVNLRGATDNATVVIVRAC